MRSESFAYWLQGFLELSGAKVLDERQTASLKAHLALVFKHEIDPSIDGGDPVKAAEHQAIHDGFPSGIGGVGPGGALIRC